MKQGRHRISALVRGRVKRITVDVVDSLAFASAKVDEATRYRVAVSELADGRLLVWRQWTYSDSGESEDKCWVVSSREEAIEELLSAAGEIDDVVAKKIATALDSSR